MSLVVKNSLIKSLPSSVTNALGKMPEEQQAVFEDEYQKKRRNTVLYVLLAVFLPIQFFLEGRVVTGLIFWFTLGGLGIWYVIEILTVAGRTKTHNEEEAKRLIRDMNIMGS
ncbi:hypothetical protein [Yoonia sp.]|uniref:hypothetical protein n=1 Tax=Yoonia sp. TaxID=2212373 RepID=UPI00358E1531